MFPFVYIRAIFLKGGSERLDMSRVRPGLRRHTVSLVLPLGAGAILKDKGYIVAFMRHEWKADDFPRKFGVRIGKPAWQTFFELLAIALPLEL